MHQHWDCLFSKLAFKSVTGDFNHGLHDFLKRTGRATKWRAERSLLSKKVALPRCAGFNDRPATANQIQSNEQ